jgi:hypothetical protein
MLQCAQPGCLRCLPCLHAQVLGKGQFGTTRLATDRKTGQQVACKSISKRKLVSAEDIEDVRRQVVGCACIEWLLMQPRDTCRH